MHNKFARVIIDRAIRRELDYAVPESLSARVERWERECGFRFAIAERWPRWWPCLKKQKRRAFARLRRSLAKARP